MSATDDLIAAIEQRTGRVGKRNGKNTRLLCPAHDDHDPSLDVAEGDNGWPLTQCRSHSCSFDDICAAIGKQPGDFAPAQHGEWTPRGEAVAIYDYVNERGDLLYQVCRTADKQFPQRRPDPSSESGWRWNLEGVTRVLYRLPEVLTAADEGSTVYITEGEKDAEAIRKAGAIATCNPGGAGKWRDEYAAALHGAHVVVVADRDDPGVAHAHTVAASLAAHLNGTADTIKIMRARAGKDVADHLAAGFTLDELVPLAPDQGPAPIVFETLEEFLERDLPPNVSLVGKSRNGTNLLPQFGWVMPWGPAGAGKTSVLVDLIFHACSGIDWVDFQIDRPLKIVVVINEGVPGGLQDKLRQKKENWDHDGPLTNLAVYASPWGEFSFKNERAVAHARDYALDFQADYVTFDPLHTLGTIGAGAPEETEKFKHQLRDFGLWQDLGVITVHHSNKSGMISGDWERHPDTVILLEKDGKSAATKLTIKKARPADPEELGVPFLLDWETDTLGYTRRALETEKSFDEQGKLSQVLEVLSQSQTPMSQRAMLEVVGDSKDIRAALKRWAEKGQIVDLTPESTRFQFVHPDRVSGSDPDQPTQAHDWEQTSMVEPDERVSQTLGNQPTKVPSPEPDENVGSWVGSPKGTHPEHNPRSSGDNDPDDIPFD